GVGPGLDHPERERGADHREARAEAPVARVDERRRVGGRRRRAGEHRHRDRGARPPCPRASHPAGRPDCSNCCWVQLVEGGTAPGPYAASARPVTPNPSAFALARWSRTTSEPNTGEIVKNHSSVIEHWNAP